MSKRRQGIQQDAAKQLEGEGEPSAPHTGRTRSQVKRQEQQQQEEDRLGTLSHLPVGVLEHCMSLLAAEEGGSCIRLACRWLRRAFDRCNTRLVLRRTEQQCPGSFPARLLDLVRCSPCVSSLTLAAGMNCVTWPQVRKAGGSQLLQRLERLCLIGRRDIKDLEALAACTRLQHLDLTGCWYQARQQAAPYPGIFLNPLAACSGLQHLILSGSHCVLDLSFLAVWSELRTLELGCCPALQDYTPLAACMQLQVLRLKLSIVEDLGPLAACTELQELRLEVCDRLVDLGPLAACQQLRNLDLNSCWHVQDLVLLAACARLQELGLRFCSKVQDLAPLAACVGLQELDLSFCSQVQDLGPLTACVRLQELGLRFCSQVQDLGPLAACVGLQELNLSFCSKVQDLGPLAACVALRVVDLEVCKKVELLKPLAACLGLESLNVKRCSGLGSQRMSLRALAGLPKLVVIKEGPS